MKTIRLTWIALSIAALLVVAIAPAASAACSRQPRCLKGTYAFRLDPATGFAADLATDGDPGNVSGAAEAERDAGRPVHG